MNKALQEIIEEVNSAKRLRVWSLILTFFGDAVVPRSGTISAQTVSSLMNEFGIEDGAVRTAFSRLATDEWVIRKKQGRSSFYSIAEKGYAPFAQATSKIYAIPETTIPTEWILALGQLQNKNALEKLLGEHNGFLVDTNIAVFNEPSQNLLKDLKTANCLITKGTKEAVPTWVGEHSKLQSLAIDFKKFNSIFQNLPENLPLIEAMTARCLLIHEWRRLVLRMPNIPAQLLPKNWPAETCGKLVAEKYASLLPQSEKWIEIEDAGNRNKDITHRFITLRK